MIGLTGVLIWLIGTGLPEVCKIDASLVLSWVWTFFIPTFEKDLDWVSFVGSTFGFVAKPSNLQPEALYTPNTKP